MDVPGWLWVVFTIAGAGTQTVRNALQRGLTEQLGTIGATHVRFLFGLPFGLLFLAAAWAAGTLAGLAPTGAWAAWTLMGAVFQIAGTALMLAAMRERAFVVAIAYVKTEPVQIALFGLVFLGERLGATAMAGVLVATAGVLLMSLPETRDAGTPPERSRRSASSLRPALLGIGSGAMFALSAVGFRGGLVALGEAPFAGRAVVTLAGSLLMQTVLLTGWLLARDPPVLRAILRAWRPSLAAGVAGASASLMWFLAFALQSAAAVRTVGLVEILFAQAASRRLFAQTPGRREALGIVLMLSGLGLLLLSA